MCKEELRSQAGEAVCRKSRLRRGKKHKRSDLTKARTSPERGRAVTEVPVSVPGLGFTRPHQTVQVIQAAVGGEFSQRWQAAGRQEIGTGSQMVQSQAKIKTRKDDKERIKQWHEKHKGDGWGERGKEGKGRRGSGMMIDRKARMKRKGTVRIKQKDVVLLYQTEK